jgi:hypothetical protein
MRKIIIGLGAATIAIAAVILVACNNDNTDKIDEIQGSQKEVDFIKDNINIKYSSKIVNGSFNFTLKIQDDNIAKSINENFIINIEKLNLSDLSDLSVNISNQISFKQKELSKKFSKAEIERIAAAMKNLIDNETKNIEIEDLKDLKMQGLFMSYSLVKSINRQLIKNKEKTENLNLRSSSLDGEYLDAPIYTTNTVYEGFNRGLSSFALIEDLIINVNDLSSYIDEDLQYAEEKGFLFVQEILNSFNTSNVSIYELDQAIVAYTRFNPEKFEGETSPLSLRWPKGSDHGCCGNYSGPCLYWHWACYVHDVLCTNCDPGWFCLPGCVPDAKK